MHRFTRQLLAACGIAAALAAAQYTATHGAVVQGHHQGHATQIALSTDPGRVGSLPCAAFLANCIVSIRPHGLCPDPGIGAVERRAAPACYPLLYGVHSVHFH